MVTTLLLLVAAVVVVDGAHSRRRVVVSSPRTAAAARYDRSITTFDPSGRLLQVEYGIEASQRGDSSIISLLADNGMIYVVVVSSPSPSASSSSTKPKGQRSTTTINNHGIVHRIDDHILMFCTGLMGDAKMLAGHLCWWCQQSKYNEGEVPTTKQAARYLASVQHKLTRTTGARPFGCTAIVVGIDPTAVSSSSSSLSSSTATISASTTTSENSENKLAGKPTSTSATSHRSNARSNIFCSNPGGILEDCLYCASGGGGSEQVMSVLQDKYYQLQDSGTCSPQKVISELVGMMIRRPSSLLLKKKTMLPNDDHDDDGSSSGQQQSHQIDAWIIQPSKNKRGGIRTVCLLNVGSRIRIDDDGQNGDGDDDFSKIIQSRLSCQTKKDDKA